ncbi:MAG: leucine-rich repeat protein, partial [Acutalibacteraceae bacterium]|nr:leucine-rich repeat protein [Acutalibacteraceae bacterium]
MKIRKFIAVFMSVIILCTVIFSVPASATYIYTDTDTGLYFYYLYDFEIQPLNSSDAEIVSITLYHSDYYYQHYYVPNSPIISITTIEIPSSIGGYNITSIAKDVVISKDTGLIEIILPDTISTLESETFYNCKNITKVYIPPTVSVIGEDVFCYSYGGYYNYGYPSYYYVDFTIYGEKDSAAYLYAVENDIPFVEFPQETSTTELDYWIDYAKKLRPYDTSGYSGYYVSSSQSEDLMNKYTDAVYIRNNFFTVQSDIDTAAYNLEVSYKRLILEATINYVEYNIINRYAYVNTSPFYDLSYQIYSAKNCLEQTSITPSELDIAISNINNSVDNLVLQSEYDLKTFIDYYCCYNDHRLSEICTTDTYSQLYDTIS